MSNESKIVYDDLKLFESNRKKYFAKHEEELWDRGIEVPEEITNEIALIDALIKSKSIAYVDYASPADGVLSQLNDISLKALEQSACFERLQAAYRELGDKNAIGNFLYNDELGPRPVNCLAQAGYALGNIDEGSDSFSFFIAKIDEKEKITRLADFSSVKLMFF